MTRVTKSMTGAFTRRMRARTAIAAALPLFVTAVAACGTASNPEALGSASSTSACDRTTATSSIGKPAPAARDFPALGYDAQTCQVVLFGGGSKRDTWTWDATGWTEQHPAHIPPSAQTEVAAFDPMSKHLLLVVTPTSGVNGGVTTWSWEGGDWHQVIAAHTPTVTDYTSLVLDSTTGKLLLISTSPQSWSWTGDDWAPDSVPPAMGADVVFDKALGTLVAVRRGGESNVGPPVSKLVPGSTGQSPFWQSYEPGTGPAPGFPIGYSLYHEALGKVVYFMPGTLEGPPDNQTWTWSDGTWSLWPPGSQPRGFWRSHGTYDPALGAIVFFGGGDDNGGVLTERNETWTLTTQGWSQVG